MENQPNFIPIGKPVTFIAPDWLIEKLDSAFDFIERHRIVQEYVDNHRDELLAMYSLVNYEEE